MIRKINMENNNCETKSPCIQKMVHKIKKSIPEMIGIAIGAAGGFIYYKTVGCSTGSCPIVSNPWSSTIFGGVIGYIIGYFLNKNKK